MQSRTRTFNFVRTCDGVTSFAAVSLELRPGDNIVVLDLRPGSREDGDADPSTQRPWLDAALEGATAARAAQLQPQGVIAITGIRGSAVDTGPDAVRSASALGTAELLGIAPKRISLSGVRPWNVRFATDSAPVTPSADGLRAATVALFALPGHGAAFDSAAVADALEDVFTQLGTTDVGELLATSVEEGAVSFDDARGYLAVAGWDDSERGGALQLCIEQWLLQANSEVRVRLALTSEVYPFSTTDEMERVFAGVSLAFPDLARRLEEMVAARREYDNRR